MTERRTLSLRRLFHFDFLTSDLDPYLSNGYMLFMCISLSNLLRILLWIFHESAIRHRNTWCFQLPYTMSVDISNPTALSSSLNISQAGDIPLAGLQTWALSLHCGPYDAEIDLTLRINVSLSRKNTTHLEFRRKKICLKDKSYIEPEEVLVAVSGSTTGGQIFYAAIGCACAVIAVIFILAMMYYVRNKKTTRHRDPLQ